MPLIYGYCISMKRYAERVAKDEKGCRRLLLKLLRR